MTGLNARFKQLYDAAAFPLTAVGGTGNAVTATLSPVLYMSGLLDGMGFTITWAADNTGGVTLALNGGSPVPVVGPDGIALPAGSLGSGLRSLLSYAAGKFILMSPSLLAAGGGGAASRYYWQFTASTSWVKPDGLSPDTLVLVEAWGGGGGGGPAASSGGGGGGGYARREFRIGDLPATVTVTIGAGGAVSTAGGNTTFGAFLTAFHGGHGANSTIGSSGNGGGGGGTNEAGGNATGTDAGLGGFQGGGNGDATPLNNAGGIYGGGGGASSGGTNAGGRSVFGGGGGAAGSGPAGLSLWGGNGGAGGSAGSAPGGGGGRGAAGARGEVRVWI